MALQHWLQLSLTDGLGPILTRRLLAHFGSAELATTATVTALRLIEGIGTIKADRIATSLRAAGDEVPRVLDRCQALGVRLLTTDDHAYPLQLRAIPDPPTVIYLQGQLEARDVHAVAIVGSRKCTHYGREQADRLASLMAGAGLTVLSGGARGVDSAAHRGALRHPQGRTIAVVGSGLDKPYPGENAPLFREISAGRGAVLSEYPPGTPPAAENFPRRNRIVSGMSRGVLVVEADQRSGALITARQAGEEQGRTVFALPGRIDNPLSAGCHALIKDGAVLTTSLDDILQNLTPLPDEAPTMETVATPAAPLELFDTKPAVPVVTAVLSDEHRRVLDAVDHESTTVDRIIEASALSAAEVLRSLTMLTLKGHVRRVDGQTYQRKR